MAGMVWNRRNDVGPSERCYVGVDKAGRTFGYVQDYEDGTASLWFELMGKGIATPSPDAARRRAAERAEPLEIIAIDSFGGRHLSGRYGKDDPGFGYLEESKLLARALLKNLRAHGGIGNFGHPALALNTSHKIESVQIVANDDTVLLDEGVAT